VEFVIEVRRWRMAYSLPKHLIVGCWTLRLQDHGIVTELLHSLYALATVALTIAMAARVTRLAA